MTSDNRLDWVDISKGITIILMVIGHTSIPKGLSNWIWSFHMPFFFIISALFVGWEKSDFKDFACRKTKVLIYPFVVYSIINLLLWHIVYGKTLGGYALEVLSDGWGGVALWFIPIFYLSTLACKVTKRKLCVVSGVAGILLSSVLCHFEIVLPWNMSVLPFAYGLMTITRFYASHIRNFIAVLSVSWMMLLSVTCIAVGAAGGYMWRLDMCINQVNPIAPVIVDIAVGVMAVIGISVVIQRFNVIGSVLKKVGRNTYEIMAFSQISIALMKLYIESSVVRYLMLIPILVVITYIRKAIEGKFSKVEAI